MTDNEVLLETSIKTTDSFSEGNDFEVNDDAVKVKGFAAHVGVMNRQTFTKEALEKAASSFVGVPIVALHSDGTEVVVGTTHYTDVRHDDSCGKDGLYYEGEMGNEYNETKNVKRGYLSKVSIKVGAKEQPSHFCNICGQPIGKCSHNFKDADFNPIRNDFFGKHIAIVTEPADRDSSIISSFSDSEIDITKLEDYFEDYKRRTNMSDFEEKYVNLMEEFSQYKDSKKEEIDGLKNEFKEQKTELETQMVSETEKYMNLKNEFDSLSSEKEEMEKELNEFRTKFAEQEEARLTSLRDEVSALNKEVYGNLTDEQINSFEESTLQSYKDLFAHQKENMPSIKPELNPGDQYSDNEDADPIDSLLSKI